MSDPDVYLAVPLDVEEEAVHPSVRVLVSVMQIDPISYDEDTTTLRISEDKLAMTLALEILKQVRDKPGKGVAIKLSASVKLDSDGDLQCERLTEEEAAVVHQRFLDKMEES